MHPRTWLLSLLPLLHAAPEAMMQAPAAEAMPKQKIVSLTVEPAKVVLGGKFEAAQVLVTAKLQSGEVADVTRFATLRLGGDCAEVSKSGHLEARKNGTATLSGWLIMPQVLLHNGDTFSFWTRMSCRARSRSAPYQ